MADLSNDGRLESSEVNIVTAEGLPEAFAGIDGLFHMAVLPLTSSAEDVRTAFQVNALGSLNVFEAAAEVGVRKVVYSSASSVYGDTDETMDETHALGTVNSYGATKLCAELLLRAFGTHHDLNHVILRYMNVYGPGLNGGLVPAVIRRLRAGNPPLIFGDGGNSFDFVHITDVVEANILAMESDVTSGAFNVGGGEELTVLEVVDKVKSIIGSDLEPEFHPAPVGDVRRRVGSSDKAGRALGYKPLTSFSAGLAELVEASAPK
jgi:UDP-glucose 4-epimerase